MNRIANKAKKRPVSLVLMWAGLFTSSWDRLFGVKIYGFGFKIPLLCFALSVIAHEIDNLDFARRRPHVKNPAIMRSLGLVAIFMLLPICWALDTRAVIMELVAVFITAFIPLISVYRNIVRYSTLEESLTWFIRGGITASVYGLYQLLAFYLEIPQGLVYQGLSGEFGRISAFNYEPAYFGYFLITVIAAIVARAHIRGQVPPIGLIGFLLLVLLLAGSRATLIVVPVFAALLVGMFPTRRVLSSALTIGIIILAASAGFVLAKPQTTRAFVDRALTIVDVNETTSNAPRLRVARAAVEVIRSHPLGVGGGNFYLHADGIYLQGSEAPPGRLLIANNIWLQALLDGGWPLLTAEILLVGNAAYLYFRRKDRITFVLFTGWLTVILVGGMVTSYFFNNHLWATLGLVAASGSGSGAPIHRERTLTPSRPSLS